MLNYTAITYFGKNEINRDTGNNIETLFVKMLAGCLGKFGDFNGKVVNNRTDQIVRTFRTCALE